MKSEKKFCTIEHLDSSVVAVRKDREVVANCDHLAALKFSHAPVYAFTEQGVAKTDSVI